MVNCQCGVYAPVDQPSVLHSYLVMYSEWDKTRLEMCGVCLPQVVPNVAHVKWSVLKLCMPYSEFQNVLYTVVYVTR